jgi:hypothetical protein
MRNKNFNEHIKDLKNEANILSEKFDMFSDGLRMIFLLERKKDGGNTNEEKRIFESYVTTNKSEFNEKLFNLLLLQSTNENARIYLSVNKRNQNKIIREIHNSLVEHYYADDVCKKSIQKKIIKNPRHFVMQPSTKDENYFIIDVDDRENADVMGEALTEMDRLNVEEVFRYRTKNGWHIITKPFNLGLWKHESEIKKDGLILLKY